MFKEENHNRLISFIKTLFSLFLIIFLLISDWNSVLAQPAYWLDWDSVLFPGLSFNQTFENVNNTGVNVNFTVVGENVTELYDDSSYSGVLTGLEESLVFRLDLATNTQNVTMNVNFSQPVANVQFTLHDIDRQYLRTLSGRYSYSYIDRLAFQGVGADGLTNVPPVFSNLGKCIVVNGSVVDGTGSNPTDADCSASNNNGTNYGDVTVTFPGEITSISFVYGNATNKPNLFVSANPSTQVIGIGDISFESAWDYGDLPSAYDVNNLLDARHWVPAVPQLYLGTQSPDGEFLAFASDLADGENSNGADEDAFGIFPGIPVSSNSFVLVVPLVNQNTVNATLAGWIDFNMDGVFSGAEFASSIVPAGATSTTLTWNSIPVLSAGTTFARLRLASDFSSIDNSTSAGSASDGEVEDYSVSIQSATAITLSSFEGTSGEQTSLYLTMASFTLILGLLFSENQWRKKILARIKRTC